MVNQVQIVAILMIVQGALASVMGLFYAAMGPTMFALMSLGPGSGSPQSAGAPPDAAFLAIMSAVYIGMGVVVLASGVLNIVAGIRALRFRARTLGLVALFSNIVPMFTCYCMPTAIGVMIYGLIVFFQPDVVRAFALAAEGETPERIRRMFTRYPHEEEEDEEDSSPPEPDWPAPPRSDRIRGERDTGSEGITPDH